MPLSAIASGAAGAVALTAVHEAARHTLGAAPRMDVLGERAIAAAVGPMPEPQLHAAALAGDLAANTAFYALVVAGEPAGAVARGALLGLVAGLGAVVLPGPLGLGAGPSRRTPQTAAMTVGWYTLGGLVAGCVYSCFGADDGNH